MRDSAFDARSERGARPADRAAVRGRGAGGGNSHAPGSRPAAGADRADPALLWRSPAGARRPRDLEVAGTHRQSLSPRDRRRAPTPRPSGRGHAQHVVRVELLRRRRRRSDRRRQSPAAHAGLAAAGPGPGAGRGTAARRGRLLLQRHLARLCRSADGDGARPLQRRDQPAAVAPVHSARCHSIGCWGGSRCTATADCRRRTCCAGCSTSAATTRRRSGCWSRRRSACPPSSRFPAAPPIRAASSSAPRRPPWCTRRRSALPITGSASTVAATTVATTA